MCGAQESFASFAPQEWCDDLKDWAAAQGVDNDGILLQMHERSKPDKRG